MAAAAYDVAAFHFRGQAARLNFPELVGSLPRPASSRPEDVQLAAHQAALKSKRPLTRRPSLETGGRGTVVGPPVTVGLSPSQIQAINESPLDSPKMWMQMAAEAALILGFDDHVMCNNDDEDDYDEELEENQPHESMLWDF